MLVRVALGAATVVVGFLGGVQLHQVVASSGEPVATFRAIDPSARRDDEVVFEDCPQAAMAPPYPVNENGMSYGSGAAIDEDDPGPDLVAAYGTNGRCGFVRSAEARNQTDPDGQAIPLYAQDGVTVIGEFRIGPGRVLTSGAPEPARSTP
ncbi:hypothetical protein [uncultured Nocardioides sp.]|uniref:hypothetical protein n=1 Tax=uncultured Nocardioides sp. TaxID=198441 RepID=UPI00261ADD1E|nr:hypothetical protein [uncultured Nocardioides sp.]